jgi:DNA-binding response OmpR family regulator
MTALPAANGTPTVLIVDDDARIRKLLTWTLENHFQVVAAADGLTALETARQIKPDLYLLDISMPGMSGIELCRQLRASRAILEHVWGPAYREDVHLLRVNVARLRRKIEQIASQPRYVLTHSRAGYSLAALAG